MKDSSEQTTAALIRQEQHTEASGGSYESAGEVVDQKSYAFFKEVARQV